LAPILTNLISFREELILRLCAEGFSVTLVCSYEEEYAPFTESGVNYINVNIDRRGANPSKELALLKSYYKLLKKTKPDCVLTYTTKCSIYGGLACRRLRIPCIINNSGLIDPKRISPLFGKVVTVLYKIGFAKASHIMYQNSDEKEVLNRILSNKVPNTLLPGSGVNLAKYAFCKIPKDGPLVFLMICRIQKEKGIEEYLNAVRYLKPKYGNVRFCVLGGFDEDYHKEIDELVNAGLLDYHTPVKDVRPFVQECSCVVNPSYHEGMSNVLLEAAAMGRPLIASDCPGCNDIVKDGINGSLVKVADTQSLIEKMEQFISLPFDEKVTLGINARRIVEKSFDRNIVINQYLKTIYQILPNS